MQPGLHVVRPVVGVASHGLALVVLVVVLISVLVVVGSAVEVSEDVDVVGTLHVSSKITLSHPASGIPPSLKS